MSYALALIGFLGFFITNIYMIIQAVKKKFRKKLLLPPLICFILFIIGASLMPSSTKVAIKTIQISLENQETEYDINQTIPVSISVEPSDADISDLTYISSAGKSDTFTFTDNKIETGTAEGSYEIYVKCGDIESNKLSITVVDVAARKAAQEQAELETQKQAELEAQEEAQKQAELEAQQKAQEEAQKQAELEAQQKPRRKLKSRQNWKLSSKLRKKLQLLRHNKILPLILPTLLIHSKTPVERYTGLQMEKFITPPRTVLVLDAPKLYSAVPSLKVENQDHVKIVINTKKRDLTTVKSRFLLIILFIIFLLQIFFQIFPDIFQRNRLQFPLHRFLHPIQFFIQYMMNISSNRTGSIRIFMKMKELIFFYTLHCTINIQKCNL